MPREQPAHRLLAGYRRCLWSLLALLTLGSLWARPARAQDQSRPFLKVSHVGPERQPIFGLFISDRASTLDDKLALAPGYRAEPVYRVSASMLKRLQDLAKTYAPGTPDARGRQAFGTLRVSYGDGREHRCFLIASLDASLDFVAALVSVLDQRSSTSRLHPEVEEAARELHQQLSE